MALLREFNIKLLTEHSIVRGSGGGTERAKIEEELEPHITNIDGTALIDHSVLHGQENNGIGGKGCSVQPDPSGVMKGQDVVEVGIEPMGFEELLEIDFVAVDDGAGVLMEAESVQKEFWAEIGVVEGGHIDVMGMRTLSSGHLRRHTRVEVKSDLSNGHGNHHFGQKRHCRCIRGRFHRGRHD
jgi:hypothetical protein